MNLQDITESQNSRYLVAGLVVMLWYRASAIFSLCHNAVPDGSECHNKFVTSLIYVIMAPGAPNNFVTQKTHITCKC